MMRSVQNCHPHRESFPRHAELFTRKQAGAKRMQLRNPQPPVNHFTGKRNTPTQFIYPHISLMSSFKMNSLITAEENHEYRTPLSLGGES
jgi:hypothetical protein